MQPHLLSLLTKWPLAGDAPLKFELARVSQDLRPPAASQNAQQTRPAAGKFGILIERVYARHGEDLLNKEIFELFG